MKVEVESQTLSRLASCALAYDCIVKNRTLEDEKQSQALREEISKLPLTFPEYNEMMLRTFKLLDVRPEDA